MIVVLAWWACSITLHRVGSTSQPDHLVVSMPALAVVSHANAEWGNYVAKASNVTCTLKSKAECCPDVSVWLSCKLLPEAASQLPARLTAMPMLMGITHIRYHKSLMSGQITSKVSVRLHLLDAAISTPNRSRRAACCMAAVVTMASLCISYDHG